jgi:RNA polymerase-binding protein DksA
MYYIVPAAKSVDDAARDLEAAVRKHQFGVLHVLDLKETLTKKGFPLGPQCRIFEVCNPLQATRVLQRDMRLNMALPCRISVFEDQGATKIGTILPAELLRALSHDRGLAEVAETVEATIKAIIDDAAAPADTRTALLQRRATLAREIQAGTQQRAAERSGNVPDTGELAAEDVARDVTIAEIDRDSAEVEAIDAALERLATGTYGQCLDCGTAIDSVRLQHTPEAALCVACQQRREGQSPRRLPRL